MILSELLQRVKNDLPKILEGYYDDKFSKEQLLMLTKMSFLLNHIEELSERLIQFSFNGTSIKINIYKGEENWVNILMTDDSFKLSFNQFIRDYKINKLGI